MLTKVTVAGAQVNPRIFEKAYNLNKIIQFAKDAHQRGAKIVIFPECALTGYCFVILLLLLVACGGIKYSEISKEALQFHPHSIAVLPTNVGNFEQARGIVERQVATELVDR